jgi:hypothetical protein
MPTARRGLAAALLLPLLACGDAAERRLPDAEPDAATALAADASATDASTPDAAADCALVGSLRDFPAGECRTCIEARCCAELNDVFDTPAGLAFFRCAYGCLIGGAGPSCHAACVADHPEGSAMWDALQLCSYEACYPEECGPDDE